MNLDRSLIKQQARAIIKNKVMKLFLTAFIVSVCCSIFTSASVTLENVYSDNSSGNPFSYNYGDDYDFGYGSDEGGVYDYGYFDDFGTDNADKYDYSNDFHSFGAEISVLKNQLANVTQSTAINFTSGISTIISILLMPLAVSLAYFFVEFIRGKEYELGAGIKSVFSNAFTVNYGKKLGVSFIRTALIYVLCLLFLIPGIIFNYSSYFAFELMCDYPELSPWQAIKLSKKMIRGNRSELFVLDLSFIPWFILCVLIFPIIYVMPYYMTVKALYYENFKIRAITTGKLTEDDFLSEQQKFAKYSAQFTNQNGEQNTYAQQNNGANYYGQPNGAYSQQYSNPTDYTQPNQNPTGYAGANQNPTGYAGTYQNPAGFNGGANMNNPYGAPIYYNPPVNHTEQNAQRDIYANMAQSTVTNSNETANADSTQNQPDFTVKEPQAPVFTEPQEPAETFVEPTEPTEPQDFTQQAAEPTVTEQPTEQAQVVEEAPTAAAEPVNEAEETKPVDDYSSAPAQAEETADETKAAETEQTVSEEETDSDK